MHVARNIVARMVGWLLPAHPPGPIPIHLKLFPVWACKQRRPQPSSFRRADAAS